MRRPNLTILLVLAGIFCSVLSGCGQELYASQTDVTNATSQIPVGRGESEAAWWMDAAADAIVSDAVVNAVTPSVLPVRVVEGQTSTDETREATALRLGLGDIKSSGEIGLSDGDWHLLFPNPKDVGCLTLESSAYMDGSFDDAAWKGQPINLPSLSDAAEVATDFLASIGWWRDASVTEVYEKSNLMICSQGKPDVTIPTSLGVRFSQSADGHRLVGPGAKYEVVIGGDGQTLEFTCFLQSTHEGGQVSVWPVGKGIEDLRAGKGLLPSFTPEKFDGIVVEDVVVGYYVASQRLSPSAYLPVFIFTVRNAAGESGTWIIPATEGLELTDRR